MFVLIILLCQSLDLSTCYVGAAQPQPSHQACIEERMRLLSQSDSEELVGICLPVIE